MKTYTFELVITEGNHELWEEMLENGKSGCDELFDHVKSVLSEGFADEFVVKLVRYEDKNGN